MNQKYKLKDIVFLHLNFLIYAASSVFIKYAAVSDFFSLKFFLYGALAMLLSIIYAVFWQQILRRFKLSFASVNRSASMLWTVLFGLLLFNESISFKGIIGIILIIIGIVLTVTADEQ